MTNPYQQDLSMPEMTDTQAAIHQAYLKVYAKTQKVSVRQVCLETPIARSTFYTYYTDLEDLKREIEDVTLAKLIAENHGQIQADKQDFIQRTFAFVSQHRAVFETFLIIRPNLSFIDKWKEAIKYDTYPSMKHAKAEEIDFSLEIFASAVIAAFTYHLKKPASAISINSISQLVTYFLRN